MYIALNGSLTAGAKLNWPEFARLAAKLGYPGVDVNLGAAMKAGVEETRALLGHLRLKPAVVGFPVNFRGDDAAFEADFKNLEPAARFAAAIGCPRMATWIMPSSETPKAELRKIYHRRFARSAAILSQSGVRLGLEFIGPLTSRQRQPHEFIWRMDEMLEFAKECGPNVGLLLDVWHWHHARATAADILTAGRERIVHVHVSDAPDLPPEKILDNERLMPGEGIIDFKTFFTALKKTGYEDAISPEVLGPRVRGLPPEEGARLGLETTRAVMKKAGVA